MTEPVVNIVGAGLAGCEAALTLAARGIQVRLFEQKPKSRTPAQTSDRLCELVCSNSFRGAALSNAVGLLMGAILDVSDVGLQANSFCLVGGLIFVELSAK